MKPFVPSSLEELVAVVVRLPSLVISFTTFGKKTWIEEMSEQYWGPYHVTLFKMIPADTGLNTVHSFIKNLSLSNVWDGKNIEKNQTGFCRGERQTTMPDKADIYFQEVLLSYNWFLVLFCTDRKRRSWQTFGHRQMRWKFDDLFD